MLYNMLVSAVKQWEWVIMQAHTSTRQASLSSTNSQSLLKLMSIESLMPSNHLILCRPFILLHLNWEIVLSVCVWQKKQQWLGFAAVFPGKGRCFSCSHRMSLRKFIFFSIGFWKNYYHIFDNQTFFLEKIIDHFDKNVQLFLW